MQISKTSTLLISIVVATMAAGNLFADEKPLPLVTEYTAKACRASLEPLWIQYHEVQRRDRYYRSVLLPVFQRNVDTVMKSVVTKLAPESLTADQKALLAKYTTMLVQKKYDESKPLQAVVFDQFDTKALNIQPAKTLDGQQIVMKGFTPITYTDKWDSGEKYTVNAQSFSVMICSTDNFGNAVPYDFENSKLPEPIFCLDASLDHTIGGGNEFGLGFIEQRESNPWLNPIYRQHKVIVMPIAIQKSAGMCARSDSLPEKNFNTCAWINGFTRYTRTLIPILSTYQTLSVADLAPEPLADYADREAFAKVALSDECKKAITLDNENKKEVASKQRR